MKPIQQLLDLNGRVALITGGAGHLGTAMAQALAEAGCCIAVADIDPASCEETANKLNKAHHVSTLGLPLDLSDEAQVRQAGHSVSDGLGRLDILINCAGFVGTSALKGWVTSFENQSVETWRKAMEVNLTAAFTLTQACAPYLEASGHGSVINIASIYGMLGPDWSLYDETSMGNPAAYAASKGGLIQLTRWLATTLGPRIRVNTITPGGVFRGQQPAFVERYEQRTPLDRMATEEDFKGAALYLASDLSAYVTGHNLVVDGGWCAW